MQTYLKMCFTKVTVRIATQSSESSAPYAINLVEFVIVVGEKRFGFIRFFKAPLGYTFYVYCTYYKVHAMITLCIYCPFANTYQDVI